MVCVDCGPLRGIKAAATERFQGRTAWRFRNLQMTTTPGRKGQSEHPNPVGDQRENGMRREIERGRC